MKAIIFSFLIVGFIYQLYGQNLSDSIVALPPKTDTINHSIAENFYNKLKPIHSNMDSYRYVNHTNKVAGYVVSISLAIIVEAYTGVQVINHPSDSKQDKILQSVLKKFNAGNYVEGRRILEENREILMNPKANLYNNYYYNLAMFYKFASDYDTALQICKKGIDILTPLKKTANHRRYYRNAQTLTHLYNLSGEIHHINGAYAIALDFYDKAIVICPRNDDEIYTKNTLARIHNNIGNTYYGLSNYSDGDIIFHEIKHITIKAMFFMYWVTMKKH